MGRQNKLLLDIRGQPMVRRVASALRAAGVNPICVVTGHDRKSIEELFRGFDARLVHNPDHASGLSSSLASGLQALDARADGALVCLGDMPWVTPVHINRLVEAFAHGRGRMICVPTYLGRRGNPVVLPRRLFDAAAGMSGDVGARTLLERHPEWVVPVPMSDPGVVLDCDTPAAVKKGLDRALTGSP